MAFMHQRSSSKSDTVRQSGGYGASRRLSPSADSNTSQPDLRRSFSSIFANVCVSDGESISRTVHSTPTVSVNDRDVMCSDMRRGGEDGAAIERMALVLDGYWY